MRIAVPQGAKLYPIDRNPLVIVRFFTEDTNGPLLLTAVWSYTIPTGRVFLAHFIYARQWVTAQSEFMDIAVIDVGTPSARFILSRIWTDSRGNMQIVDVPLQANLLSGVQIIAYRGISGSATVHQEVGMLGLEYDR
jgi:hypothetical protein